MTKNYYRSEYSDKQWKALIDKATELGCQITYSKYGNIVTIDSTDLRKWKVQPKRYRRGYCPTTFNDQRAAEHEQERLERITGFEWTIIVIPE